ncbi:MAG: 6-phosphogluconolactonase [Actinomycetota bacterium]|nr:6-phosphogluconolactonase [Actinomycetota bacterium]
MHAEVEVVEDPAEAVADRLVAAGGHVVLTGGSTPRATYERAAELRHDWSGVTFWFSDERCVPAEHELSNYRMVDRAMLDIVTGPQVHRIEGEKGPREAAELYANELAAVFGYELPEIDLMLLGIGPDAHLCSLFPHAPALGEREKPVVGVEEAGMAPLVPRVTLTLPVVDAARELVFLVTGEEKAEALERTLGEPDPGAPASLVQNAGTRLLCDEAAAGRL